MDTASNNRKPPPRRTSRESMARYRRDRKSTRLNSSHSQISYAVFCLKKKNNKHNASDRSTLIFLLFRRCKALCQEPDASHHLTWISHEIYRDIDYASNDCYSMAQLR